jgi:hypothetical protein
MTEWLWVQNPAKEAIFNLAPKVEQKEIMECANLLGIVACAVILE